MIQTTLYGRAFEPMFDISEGIINIIFLQIDVLGAKNDKTIKTTAIDNLVF